jgi:hypothetical protein
MSYEHEREDFIVTMAKQGVPADVSRVVLRHANTIQRLAVAVCNGDWPSDNGERKVETCPKCEGLWVPFSIKANGCPDCRAEALLVKALAPYNFAVETAGDPRGYCVHIYSTTSTLRQEFGVPSRRY